MNMLDRYILKQYVMTLGFAILALCIIFLVVNLMENLDDFIDQKASFGLIAKYYLTFFPEILKILTPVAVLISTLFTIGKLSMNNEVTAMKSGGLSLYRMMMPLVVFSIFLSFGQLYFNGWIVPMANSEKLEIERVYLNKSKAHGSTLFNLFFRDTPQRNVMMQNYQSNDSTGFQVGIEEYSSELSPRLLSRIEADRIIWRDTVWMLQNVIYRTFSNGIEIAKSLDSMNIALNIRHDRLIKLKMLPEEMNFDEKREHIEVMKMGGRDTRRLMIDYYSAYAFPFANFIVILFGVPFASVKKKGGIAIQIGAAMVIAFAYLIFTEISKTIGLTANLDPMLTGWGANIIFFITGLFVLFKTKT